MQIVEITEDELFRLVGVQHNPPLLQDDHAQALFQAEIRQLYDILIQQLSPFGEEGDYYGISDFAVRPSLGEYGVVEPPSAPPIREFAVTIISEKFLRSNYLEALYQFLCEKAGGYRVNITKDVDPTWQLDIFLTKDMAQVFCTSPKEMAGLRKVLAHLNGSRRLPSL